MEQRSVDSPSAYVTRVNRHLDGVEYHLRHMQRRASARLPRPHGTGPLSFHQAQSATRSSASQQRPWPSVWRGPNGGPGAREEPRAAGTCRTKTPATSTLSSPSALPHPIQARRKGAVVVAAQGRVLRPLLRRQPSRSSSVASSLLSSSLSTLLSSSSSSSASSSSLSPRRQQGMAISSVSSTLTSATLVSFSSLEGSPAGEIATRWLQWRRAAYHLLASHYEKCHTLLTHWRQLGLQRQGRAVNDLIAAFRGEERKERRSLTSPSESSDSIDDINDGNQALGTVPNDATLHPITTSTYAEMLLEREAERVAGQLVVLAEEEAATRHALEDEALRAADGIGRARNRSAREAAVREKKRRIAVQAASAASARAHVQRESRRVEEEEAARRRATERDEEEKFTDLMEAIDRGAEMLLEREAERVARPGSPFNVPLPSVLMTATEGASAWNEKATQTPRKLLRVKATQTEGEVCTEPEPVVHVQSSASTEGSQLTGGRWRQRGSVRRPIPAGEWRMAVAAEGKSAAVAKEGGDGASGAVVAGSPISSCCSKSVQTSFLRSISVQVCDAYLESQRPREALSCFQATELQQGEVLSPRQSDGGSSKSTTCTGPSLLSGASRASGGAKGDEAGVPVSVEEITSREQDAARRSNETDSPRLVDSTRKKALRPPERLARRRHGGRAQSAVETHRLKYDSLASDEEEKRAFTPHWDLDTIDFDWSIDLPPCNTAVRRLVHVEMRHRRHVERHELLARNEVRWDELNRYRTWALWQEAAVVAADAACEASKDTSEGKDGEEEEEKKGADAQGRLFAAEAVVFTAAAAENGDDDKENIVPCANVLKPAGAVQRGRSTAWCVDMTGGPSGTPPHLRDRPWAAMLTRRKSQSCGAHSFAVVRLPLSMPRASHRTPNVSSVTVGAPVRWGLAGGDMRGAPPQRAPETVFTKKCAELPGYAQQYERRLMWKQRQQHDSGLPEPEPIYRRATTSFLESAEWRYQKMYVDRYLFVRRRDRSARKCADAVCEEVSRAQVTWELQQS
ncbi:hypothetical protein TraAM80_08361 [Trypanosoma rangeli]|uniref:Uncharacterized protein n=1 Tax=Trypanosoma rangeli TaxID=5698 RepID=A0A422N101_TRYRA|nr:uncharacterized protein TraAM80_08361 [Trypanosoma rangeli]RNE99134.1 hypothetical protein TraAM80_08361 [Trypanosoma rangeli]|eukprot:RNE99134.1 hypothetical protein TraAM80_08361 [Trypanosoma rangeli]